MNIYTAALHMQQGYRVMRPVWPVGEYVANCCGVLERRWSESVDGQTHSSLGEWLPYLDDIVADDWEIITQGIIKDFPITYSD